MEGIAASAERKSPFNAKSKALSSGRCHFIGDDFSVMLLQLQSLFVPPPNDLCARNTELEQGR